MGQHSLVRQVVLDDGTVVRAAKHRVPSGLADEPGAA